MFNKKITSMNKVKRKHFLVVSDTGVMDKASKILEIKGSTLCYSEKDLMWKDTKSYGVVEFVPGWRPGKKTIQEARVRVATLKSKNYLVDLENLVVKLEHFGRLTRNSAFMPSIKEKVLENYFDKNFDTWRTLISPYHNYKDYWIDIDVSLESKIREKRREVHVMSEEIREVFHPSGKSGNHNHLVGRPKRLGCLTSAATAGIAIGSTLALTAAAANALAAAAIKSKINKKEK
jgi:hypothetical protein